MKRCPECGREYDNTMMFCLDDGAELLYGPASMDEPQTAILSDPEASAGGHFAEAKTRAQIHTTAAEPQSRFGEPSEKHSFSANRAAEPEGSAGTRSGGFDKRLLLAAVALAVIALGGYFGYRYLGSSTTGQIDSIAVMPFANESGDPGIEYLSDGMTETLINSLSELPDVNVKARTLVFQYKGKAISPAQLATELGVQAILTGRVVQRGDQISLSVELIDGTTQNTLWGKKYERTESGLVTLQSELARDVSGRLASKPSGGETSTTEKGGTNDPVAYQAYLKGRFYWNRRNSEYVHKAIEQFRIATDRDPGYALAFAGLADCYAIYAEYTGTPDSESLPKAKAFAEKALSLDKTLAAPHATLGSIARSTWNWAEAEREYKRAIELDPDYATAYHWYSILLRNLGRYDEAETSIKRAHELDPLSAIIAMNYADTLVIQRGDYNASIQMCLKLIEISPEFAPAYERLGFAYFALGRPDEAVAAFEKMAELDKNASFVLSELGYAYARVGRRSEALAQLKELEVRYAQKEARGTDLAFVFLGLGDKDMAFEWLEKDFEAREGDLPTISWLSFWKPIRDDPRYGSLLKRMGLSR